MKEAATPPLAGHRADDIAIGVAVRAGGSAMTDRSEWS